MTCGSHQRRVEKLKLGTGPALSYCFTREFLQAPDHSHALEEVEVMRESCGVVSHKPMARLAPIAGPIRKKRLGLLKGRLQCSVGRRDLVDLRRALVMRLLLDTRLLLWALSSPEKLSKRARQRIESSDVFVSAASIWEISIKITGGADGTRTHRRLSRISKLLIS
jgi:PIN domain-containing protein